MSYREKTPQIISVLMRKLKPGQTFEDFQKAHLPPGDVQKTAFGYDVNYFNAPTRVINAISLSDPSMIISIGLTYGEPNEVLKEVKEKIPLEKDRRKQIAQVADKVGPAMIYFVASDENYGNPETQYQQLPCPEVTQEVIDAFEALVPKKPS